MSLKKRLRVVVVCAVLQLGVMVGVPMRPDEVEELMQQMNQPKMAHVLPTEDEDGDTSAGPSVIPSQASFEKHPPSFPRPRAGGRMS